MTAWGALADPLWHEIRRPCISGHLHLAQYDPDWNRQSHCRQGFLLSPPTSHAAQSSITKPSESLKEHAAPMPHVLE